MGGLELIFNFRFPSVETMFGNDFQSIHSLDVLLGYLVNTFRACFLFVLFPCFTPRIIMDLPCLREQLRRHHRQEKTDNYAVGIAIARAFIYIYVCVFQSHADVFCRVCML